MAKKHSGLTTSDLHHPKGILVESTASMFVMSQSISTATASFHFIPDDTDTYTLGNTARAWKELYVSTGSIHFVEKDGTVARTLDVDSTGFGFGGGDVSGSTISGSKLHIVGSTFIGGDLTLGDADSDSISIGADLTSNLIPNADNNYDLGSSGKQWKDIYINGIAYIDQLGTDGDAIAAYISSGELDGVVIGGESAAAATVTTLNLTSIGGNWTNASNTVADLGTVTTIDINGGSIDGAVIGANSAVAGTFAAVVGTTIDASTDFTIDGLVISADDITNDAALEIQTAAGDITLDPGGNNVLPGSDNTDALGAAGTAWSDLFLGDGAVINFDSGDMTLTNASNEIQVSGGDLVIESTNKIGFGGAPSTDYIQKDTDIKIVAAGDIILDPAGNNVLPGSDDADDLGASGTQWKDLYIDGVAYIDTLNADALGANLDHGNYNSTNVDIDSGTIDGTTIGAASAAAGTFAAIVGTSLNVSDGNITNVGDIALDTISADDGSSLSFSNNWTNAGRTVADLGVVTTVDINGGTVDGATIGAASHTTIKGTTIDATTDFTIDGLVLTADTITNDSNLTMDLAGDLAIDVDGGDVTITDNGADLLTINATTISGSSSSSGSFAHIAVNSVSASRIEIDSIQGNWTNAGNTVADLGSVTTIDINGGTINGITDLVVADGGTGVSTLTDGGVLLGSGTGAITAMAVLGDSEMIVGDGSGDPVAESGATLRTSIGVGTGDSPQFTSPYASTSIEIGHATDTTLARSSAGVLTVEGNRIFHAGGADVPVADGGTGASTLNNLITMGTHTTGNYVATVADSGGGGITVANSGAESAAVTLELDIHGLTTDAIASGDFIAFSDEGESGDPANKETIDDVATLFAGTGLTAASAVLGVDAAQTQITSIGTIGTGVWQGTAINDDYVDTINNANKVALTALDIDGGTDVGAAIVDADLMIIDDGAGGTNRKATMSRLKTYMSGVSGGSTLGNVQVGVTAAGEIDTTSGNLIIDSAGGTTTIDDHVIVSGDFTVSGTRTIVDSTTVDIADNIIELNAGTADGGIYVKETQGGAATGSMLWDVSANRWFAGVAGSETNVVLVGTSDTLTNKTLTSPDINGGTWNGTVDGNSTAAGITWADLGSVTTIDINGGTINGITDLAVADGGTGASSLNNLITLGDHTTGNYVAAITSGTGLSGGVSSEGATASLSVDASQTQITAVGTIGTGTWAATDVAVAHGGTGASSLTANGVLIGNGTSAVTAVDLSTDGVIVIGDGSGNPTTLDVGASGGITILGTIATGVWNGTAITGTYIANDTIDSQHYAADSIDAEHYAAGSVDATAIGNDEVNSQHYAAGSIDNEHLADDAVDSDELAAGAVDDAHLSDGVATGLAGAGMTATSGVLNCIGGTGITVNADNITTTDGDIVHDNLSGFVANEHIDHSGVSISAGGILSGGGTIAASRTITLASSGVDHDATTNFVADEHIAHSGVTLTAGTGLNGGGTIAASRTFAVDAAQTAITSVLNTGLKVGYDNNDCFNFATGSDGQISVYQNMIEEFRFTAGGTFHADADVVAYSSTVASDMRLKENITDTKYGLNEVMQLRGVDYDWKRKDRGHDIGVLAQEVEKVIPELVKEHEGLHGREKFKSVDYNKLVPVLIESIKELKKEIDDLKSN